MRRRVSRPSLGPTNDFARSEVERAAKFIRTIATGRKITRVETVEDTLVYTGGITHEDFVRSPMQNFRSRRTYIFSSAMG